VKWSYRVDGVARESVTGHRDELRPPRVQVARRRTISTGVRRTSAETIDNGRQPTSSNAARFCRSRRRCSGELCQSNPSYSTATIRSGHAKSTRQQRPSRSTTVCCSTGSGNPPSCMTSRAPLSIGDSASGLASGMRPRTSTMPRRPVCAFATRRQVPAVAGTVAQRRVKGRQGARMGAPPRHLDRRPCRCCQRTSAQRRQRCTVTPMGPEGPWCCATGGRPVENMRIGGVLGVESVCGSSGAQAGRDGFSAAKVKPPKSSWRIGIALAVDIRPKLCQLPVTQVALHLAPADVLQDLRRCRDSALGGEEPLQRGGHLVRVLRVARRR
jgi:hypothetical protein